MSSRRPYWCPKTITRRPFWCFKKVLGTNLKPPVLCASAQGDKIKPIFRPIYKTLPYLQTQCQSISDWNFTEFGDTHKAAENFNPREETSRSLQWSCYSWTKIFETSVNLSAIRCLFLQCQSISDWNFTEFRDTHKAAENFNLCEETSRSLQWSCYSWTKIFETSLELICDQVLVFLFWTARGVSIQPWSKLLGQQRNSWSKWGIFVLPSTPGGAFSRLISLRVSRCFDQGCS